MKKHLQLDLYPVTVEPHTEGGYFAFCPLFQGCHAEGETFGKAIDNMRDVISVHIEARKQFAEFVLS